MRLYGLIVFGLCSLLLVQRPLYSQPAGTAPIQDEPAHTAPHAAPGPLSPEQQLETIIQSLADAESQRAALKKELKKTRDEAEAQALNADVERLSRRADQLRTTFEELATGGKSIASLEQEAERKPIDWNQEFEDIVRPLLDELKQMTERPRKIERLRSDLDVYEERLDAFDRAIAQIDETLATTESPEVKQALTELQKDWRSHREDAASRFQLLSAQLEHLLAPAEEEGTGIGTAAKEFFTGRGLNLLLAVTGFASTLVLLAAIGRVVGRAWRRRHEATARRVAKAGALLFRAFSVITALFVSMIILYARSDWLILGLLILLLFTLLVTLRQSLPRYLQEVRVLLNMGGVREGERVMYNGIPWRIKSLNIYSTLHNPLLQGGTIRVPLDQLAELQSRQYTKEDPWFPTRQNDFVFLQGDVFGKVLLQTPEIVQLQVIGSTTTYAVADYLGKNPRNLSLDGFAVPLSFGLDYSHQTEILTTVVERMCTYLTEEMQTQVFHPHLKDLIVDFNEAASSSLNLILVAVFHGAAAEHYWSIRRFLQRTAVGACNRYGWVIPFEQLMVHAAPSTSHTSLLEDGPRAPS